PLSRRRCIYHTGTIVRIDICENVFSQIFSLHFERRPAKDIIHDCQLKGKSSMPRLLKSLIGLLLLIVLPACAGSTFSGPTATAVISNTPESTLQNRFGIVPLEPVRDSGVAGTFTALDNGDGTTTINIQLDKTADFNPWGIYTTGDCVNGVPENTRPIFTL